jgi:hypothetical protein
MIQVKTKFRCNCIANYSASRYNNETLNLALDSHIHYIFFQCHDDKSFRIHFPSTLVIRFSNPKMIDFMHR